MKPFRHIGISATQGYIWTCNEVPINHISVSQTQSESLHRACLHLKLRFPEAVNQCSDPLLRYPSPQLEHADISTKILEKSLLT